MEKLRNTSFQKRWLLPVVCGCIAALFVGGIALGVAFTLNKTVPATVDIVTPPPPPPPLPPTPAKVYSDSAWQTELAGIFFGSVPTTGGSANVTVFVKPEEINVSTVQASGVNAPYSVSVRSADQATGAIQLTLLVPAGQTAATGVSVGDVTITGNGPQQ